MKLSGFWGALTMACSFQVYAGIDSVLIKSQTEEKFSNTCIGNESTMRLNNKIISIVKRSGEAYSLNLDEQENDLRAYFASAPDAGPCIVAFKYAENDINESFSLFIFDKNLDRFKISRVAIITNPEFLSDVILINYKDGPTTHHDVACYSNTEKDYYICEKREQFLDQLERREVCNETSCAEPEIVTVGTAIPVEATVLIAKVDILEKRNESEFYPKIAYLVQGDKVVLRDYYRNGDGLFFRFNYEGKAKATGWIPESAITLQ